MHAALLVKSNKLATPTKSEVGTACAGVSITLSIISTTLPLTKDKSTTFTKPETGTILTVINTTVPLNADTLTTYTKTDTGATLSTKHRKFSINNNSNNTFIIFSA